MHLLFFWKLMNSTEYHTSPKVPKYSWMTSFEVSGFRPPTKIFLTGSFFMAMAFLGSITLPSNLCSFCSRTLKTQSRKTLNIACLANTDILMCWYYRFPNYLVYTGRIFKENKAETSWPACLLVHLYGAVCHLTKFREVILKILLARVPAETTNKHFPKCKKKEKNMFSNAGSNARATLYMAVGWGWCLAGGGCKCTHCSRTSVDPMTYAGRLQLLCFQATFVTITQHTKSQKIMTTARALLYIVFHKPIHVRSDLCSSAHPPSALHMAPTKAGWTKKQGTPRALITTAGLTEAIHYAN